MFHLARIVKISIVILVSQSTGATAETNTIDSLWLKNGMMTASVKEAPLADVLDRLNAQLPDSSPCLRGIILTNGSADTVSADMKNIPLLQGLKRLFANHNYVLIQHESRNGCGKPGFYPSTATSAKIPVASDPAPGSIIEPDEASDYRAEMVEQLADLNEQAQLEAILPAAIRDPDRVVREHALKSLTLMFENAPHYLVEEMALSDPIPELRMEALQLVADRRDEWASEVLLKAAQDSDPAISSKATELLSRISALAEP